MDESTYWYIFWYNLRTAISTIGPSEKKYCRCTLSLPFFFIGPSSSESHKKRTLLIPVFVFAFLCNSFYYCRNFSHNLDEKFNFLFFMTLHCSILDRLTMIIILMIGILYNTVMTFDTSLYWKGHDFKHILLIQWGTHAYNCCLIYKCNSVF